MHMRCARNSSYINPYKLPRFGRSAPELKLGSEKRSRNVKHLEVADKILDLMHGKSAPMIMEAMHSLKPRMDTGILCVCTGMPLERGR